MTEEPKLQMIAQGREAEIFAWEDGTVLRLFRSADGHQQLRWKGGGPLLRRPRPGCSGRHDGGALGPDVRGRGAPGYCRSPGLASD